MNITPDILNNNKKKDILKQSYIENQLKQVEAKIKLASNFGYNSCYYDILHPLNYDINETTREIIKKIKKNKFSVYNVDKNRIYIKW
jgi:predicted peptidase